MESDGVVATESIIYGQVRFLVAEDESYKLQQEVTKTVDGKVVSVEWVDVPAVKEFKLQWREDSPYKALFAP